MLRGKKIVIGITGSIAAYKIPFLVRLLIREEAMVRVTLPVRRRVFHHGILGGFRSIVQSVDCPSSGSVECCARGPAIRHEPARHR